MFSAKDRKCFCCNEMTVGKLIEVLKDYDPNMSFGVDGANNFYIHKKEDGSAISIDSSSLDELYLDQGNYFDLPEVRDDEEDE